MREWILRGGAVIGLVLGCSSEAPPSGSSAPPLSSSVAQASGGTATLAAAAAPEDAPPRTLDLYVERLAWAPGGEQIAVWCGAACPPGSRSAGATGAVAKAFGRTVAVVDLLKGGAARSIDLRVPNPQSVVSFGAKGSLLLVADDHNVHAYAVPDLGWRLTLMRSNVGEALVASPDERFVAMVTDSGNGEVWDVEKNDLVGLTQMIEIVRERRPGAAVWVPPGKRVVLTSDTVPPELFGMRSRIARLNVTGTRWTRPVVRVTAQGAVAVASGDGTVALFDGETGKAKAVLRKPFDKADPGQSTAAALSPDDRLLAVATGFGELTVFDLAAQKSIDVIARPHARVALTALAWSPDGARIAFERGGAVHVVRAAEKTEPAQLDEGTIVGFAADGALVSRGPRGHVAVWADGKEKWRAPLPADAAGAVLSPDRKVLALTHGPVQLVRLADRKTATLALTWKDGQHVLAPVSGTTAADVRDVLGK